MNGIIGETVSPLRIDSLKDQQPSSQRERTPHQVDVQQKITEIRELIEAVIQIQGSIHELPDKAPSDTDHLNEVFGVVRTARTLLQQMSSLLNRYDLAQIGISCRSRVAETESPGKEPKTLHEWLCKLDRKRNALSLILQTELPPYLSQHQVIPINGGNRSLISNNRSVIYGGGFSPTSTNSTERHHYRQPTPFAIFR